MQDETKYAIFLLNQNLAQLLVHSGQRVKDLRTTLANLMNLTKNCNLLEIEQLLMQRTSGSDTASNSDLEQSTAKDVDVVHRRADGEARK